MASLWVAAVVGHGQSSGIALDALAVRAAPFSLAPGWRWVGISGHLNPAAGWGGVGKGDVPGFFPCAFAGVQRALRN